MDDHPVLAGTTVDGREIEFEGVVVGHRDPSRVPAGGHGVETAEWYYPG